MVVGGGGMISASRLRRARVSPMGSMFDVVMKEKEKGQKAQKATMALPRPAVRALWQPEVQTTSSQKIHQGRRHYSE